MVSDDKYETDYQCDQCGKHVGQNAKVCPQCGERFGDLFGPPLSQRGRERKIESDKASAKRWEAVNAEKERREAAERRHDRAWSIFGTLGIIVVIGVIAYLRAQ